MTGSGTFPVCEVDLLASGARLHLVTGEAGA